MRYVFAVQGGHSWVVLSIQGRSQDTKKTSTYRIRRGAGCYRVIESFTLEQWVQGLLVWMLANE